MLDLREMSPRLQPAGDGLWQVAQPAAVSYPVEGHNQCWELEADSFWFAHRNACLVETLRRFPPAGPILDVGAGNGYVSQGLRAAGWETLLLEAGAVGVANALRRNLRPVIWATLEEVDFRAQSLPAVGLFDVLEHVPHDDAFLRRIRRLLVPGGMLYLTVPAYGWLWSAEDERAGHFRRYTRWSLVRLLRASGFQLRFASYLFSLLPLPILLQRTLARRGAESELAAARRAHRLPHGWLGGWVECVLRWERRRIARRRPIGMGSSCLLVAQAAESPNDRGDAS